MTLKTRKIRINVTAPDGSAVAYAGVQATLTAYEIDGMIVVPTVVRGQTDINGTALLDLWPNSRGVAGSQYNVTAVKNGALLLNVVATVPDGDPATEVVLESIITPVTPPTVDAAQLAVLQAQALVDEATTQRMLADSDVLATHADAAATAADALATAADRVATGQDAAATAADRIQTAQDALDTVANAATTALDVAATSADVLLTHADAAATAADRVQTGLDAAATAADRAATGLDASATAADAIAAAADRAQTGLDALATAADRVQTGLDKTATAADRVQTGLDMTATAADRVQTGLDKTATAADRVQTGLDRSAASTSASGASSNASAAATSYTNFDKRYLGAKAVAPTLDNQGAALAVGALYFDTALAIMRVWDGAAWTNNTTEMDARILADQQLLEQTVYATDMAGLAVKELVRYEGVTDTRLAAAEPGIDVLSQALKGALDPLAAAARSVTDRAKLVAAPASASAAGTKGEFAYDTNYLYIAVALNTWKRVGLSSW